MSSARSLLFEATHAFAHYPFLFISERRRYDRDFDPSYDSHSRDMNYDYRHHPQGGQRQYYPQQQHRQEFSSQLQPNRDPSPQDRSRSQSVHPRSGHIADAGARDAPSQQDRPRARSVGREDSRKPESPPDKPANKSDDTKKSTKVRPSFPNLPIEPQKIVSQRKTDNGIGIIRYDAETPQVWNVTTMKGNQFNMSFLLANMHGSIFSMKQVEDYNCPVFISRHQVASKCRIKWKANVLLPDKTLLFPDHDLNGTFTPTFEGIRPTESTSTIVEAYPTMLENGMSSITAALTAVFRRMRDPMTPTKHEFIKSLGVVPNPNDAFIQTFYGKDYQQSPTIKFSPLCEATQQSDTAYVAQYRGDCFSLTMRIQFETYFMDNAEPNATCHMWKELGLPVKAMCFTRLCADNHMNRHPLIEGGTLSKTEHPKKHTVTIGQMQLINGAFPQSAENWNNLIVTPHTINAPSTSGQDAMDFVTSMRQKAANQQTHIIRESIDSAGLATGPQMAPPSSANTHNNVRQNDNDLNVTDNPAPSASGHQWDPPPSHPQNQQPVVPQPGSNVDQLLMPPPAPTPPNPAPPSASGSTNLQVNYVSVPDPMAPFHGGMPPPMDHHNYARQTFNPHPAGQFRAPPPPMAPLPMTRLPAPRTILPAATVATPHGHQSPGSFLHPPPVRQPGDGQATVQTMELYPTSHLPPQDKSVTIMDVKDLERALVQMNEAPPDKFQSINQQSLHSNVPGHTTFVMHDADSTSTMVNGDPPKRPQPPTTRGRSDQSLERDYPALPTSSKSDDIMDLTPTSQGDFKDATKMSVNGSQSLMTRLNTLSSAEETDSDLKMCQCKTKKCACNKPLKVTKKKKKKRK